MSSLTIKPINGNFQQQKIKIEQFSPYLIIKCGNHELYTSVAKMNNNKYYNWDDSFKLFLTESENNFYMECWDYNINNEERGSDLLANGYLNIKSIKLENNNSCFQWVNFYDNDQQLVGEVLFELLLEKQNLNNTENTNVFNTQIYAIENQLNNQSKNHLINLIPNLQIKQKVQMQVQSNVHLQQPIYNQKFQNIPITYHKINPSQNIQNFNFPNQNIQKINIAQNYHNNIKFQINKNQNAVLQHGLYGAKKINNQYQSNNY